ncbi:hypothetical protein TNCV_4741841 [Trichonephila clavipes]|nr:hypothetical protein TNCV_4741841 [Trichonephila clavipes]
MLTKDSVPTITQAHRILFTKRTSVETLWNILQKKRIIVEEYSLENEGTSKEKEKEVNEVSPLEDTVEGSSKEESEESSVEEQSEEENEETVPLKERRNSEEHSSSEDEKGVFHIFILND